MTNIKASQILITIDEIISSGFKYNGNKLIEHVKVKQKIETQTVTIKDSNKKLIYKFDLANDSSKNLDIFPIFNKLKNLCCISDYIIFYPNKNDSKLFIFLCEFKTKNTSGAVNQIHSSKSLAKYIIEMAIRHMKFKFNTSLIEYRGLVFSKDNRSFRSLSSTNVRRKIKNLYVDDNGLKYAYLSSNNEYYLDFFCNTDQ